MKRKILYVVAASAVASIQAATALQAPLPQFKPKAELQKIEYSKLISEETTGNENFYTGKPYDAAREGYLFKYRTYSSQISRWTTIDPSGFPNGSNNHGYVPSPTTQFDAQGLFYSGTSYDSSVYGAGSDGWDTTKWNLGYSPLGMFAGINQLGWAAMAVADGSSGASSWNLSSGENESARYATEYYSHYDNANNSADPQNGLSFAEYLAKTLIDSYKGTRNGSGQYSVSQFQVLYPNSTDAYFAFGHANISMSGSYTIVEYQMVFTPNVTLTDNFTFAPYANLAGNGGSATGTGYRLQTSGHIHAFDTNGSWSGTYSANVE